MTSLKPINPKFIYKLQYAKSETCACLIGSTIKAVIISSSDASQNPSIREAIDLIASENFSQNFLKAGRAFVINVKCHGSLLPLNPQQLALLVNSYKDRPMIFFFESADGGFSVYYKVNSEIKCASNIAPMFIDKFFKSVFTFELLLSSMRSEFGGRFEGSFEDMQLNVLPLLHEWRLIDLAILGNDQLCIRFLQLFENFIENVDSSSIRLLQSAARESNFEELLAVFDLNFEQKEFMMKINKDLLNVRDSSGYTLLMISVESGNVSATMFWLNLKFFDVNYEVDGTKAADLACKLNTYEILLMLLQNDSKYPKNYHKIEKSTELQMFNNKVNEIHEAIRLHDDKKAKEVLYNLKLRYYYNDSNKSAAYAALEHREFKVYKLLMMNNSAIGIHEDIRDLNLDQESKNIIKSIHDKYKSPLYQKCVLDLERKMKCLNIPEVHRPKFQFEIRNTLNMLFDIETFRPLLRIAAAVSVLDFSLDFERYSVSYLDPVEGPSTRGYYSNFSICIACKNLLTDDSKNLFLATLVHELTHFVVDYMYENSCLPFLKNDVKRAMDFHEVYEACKKNCHKEKIVADVYVYAEALRFSELIVRVNHLLAHYYDNEDMRKECESNFPELFKFYRERIYVDMLGVLEWLDTDVETESTDLEVEYVPKIRKFGQNENINSKCESSSENSPKRKRKMHQVHKDFDFEAQKLLESENMDMKTKYVPNFKVFIPIFIIFVMSFLFLVINLKKSLGPDPPLSQQLIQFQCLNVSHPWTELIATKNISVIESSNEPLGQIWRINEICNPITISLEIHLNDLEFSKELIELADESFIDCREGFKRLLVQCWKYLEQNCDEFRDVFNIVDRKLNKVMNLKEHRSFTKRKFDEIGGEC